jgi:acetylglutamate kinase
MVHGFVNRATRPLVIKLGGELLEDASRLTTVVSAVARIAGVERHAAGPKVTRSPVIIVHGGGKEIDAALKTAGIEKHQVDGLRITDEPTLDVVVSVLAGSVNTRLVAALVAAGVPAVGLTGADAGCALVDVAPPHRAVDGRIVNLGRVGVPGLPSDARLLTTLTAGGFVPVVASIGSDRWGRLLNVNADTLAGHLAASCHARLLVVAGTTPGVLDQQGSTLPMLDDAAMARLVGDGGATAGMIAKLRACERALAAGVDEVVIVDGRDGAALEMAATGGVPRNATRLVRQPLTMSAARK